jgi:transcriptional regulator with XRE-family HTH domain
MKKLQRYLKKRNLSIQDFADGIGKDHETARRYVQGLRTPRDPKTLEAIIKFTDNAVTLEDICGVKAHA